MDDFSKTLSYFPGCSLATSARESNQSLVETCDIIGLNLIELEDWNCCGSSSAHALDQKLALDLAGRNLCRAPRGRPLLIMCPSCYRNLVTARLHFRNHPSMRRAQERQWGGEIDPDLEIVSFHEILAFMMKLHAAKPVRLSNMRDRLSGLKVAPYYGCMSMFPPSIRPEIHSLDLMEKQLAAMGMTVINWGRRHRCCGTFLTVTRPDITGPLVNGIIDNAREFGADCLVTACAMCQLNLEIRCTLKNPLPTLHFSELIALSLGAKDNEPWFSRHLIDPRPLLRSKGLIS